MSAKKKYKDFESALNRLEEITSFLESGEKSLEDSIELYTEGLEISKFCDQKLTEVQKKITIVMEKNGTLAEEPFEEDEDQDHAV